MNPVQVEEVLKFVVIRPITKLMKWVHLKLAQS